MTDDDARVVCDAMRKALRDSDVELRKIAIGFRRALERRDYEGARQAMQALHDRLVALREAAAS